MTALCYPNTTFPIIMHTLQELEGLWEKKKKKGKEIRLELMGLEHLKNRGTGITQSGIPLWRVLGGISVREFC